MNNSKKVQTNQFCNESFTAEQVSLRKKRIANLMIRSAGRWLTVTFFKKDGSFRVLNGRFMVKHNNKSSALFANGQHDYLLLWDRNARGFRKVNPLAITSVASDGFVAHFDITS